MDYTPSVVRKYGSYISISIKRSYKILKSSHKTLSRKISYYRIFINVYLYRTCVICAYIILTAHNESRVLKFVVYHRVRVCIAV